MEEVSALKARLPELEAEERRLGEELDTRLAAIPNIPAADVPDGADEEANVVVHVHGKMPHFDFRPLEHDEIGARLGLDFEAAAAISGARFAVLTGPMARLHRALAQFMLDVQTGEHGYTEINPPLLVRDEEIGRAQGRDRGGQEVWMSVVA